MALQKSVILSSGISLDTAYHRVEGVAFQVARPEGNWVASIAVAVYANADARQAGKDPVAVVPQEVEAPAFAEADPRAWAYDVLKARPEFSGALDV